MKRNKLLLTCLIAGTAIVGLSGNEATLQASLHSPGIAWMQADTGQAAAGGQPADATQQTAAAPAAPAATAGFAQDQLEQLVAPIALYPDPLLSQILMASTYPLEVVEADRWVKANPGVTGDQLDAALKEQDWDASVKSLCSVPDVLKQMSENLDWTQDLGDAFLAQQSEVMDSVQKMRGIAYDEGNLKTTEQQTVSQEPDKIIVIQPADPEVIYVPTYSSTVVYGSSWGYPSYYYPPMYYPPPPGYGLISFGVGLAIGGAIWGNCNWGWGHSDIDIDINRYNNFNRNTNINSDRTRINAQGGRDGKAGWQHDSSHRKGVNYRSQDVAQNYGAKTGNNRVTREQARGVSNTAANRGGSTNRAATRDVATPSSRPSAGSRDVGSASSRPSASSRDYGGSSSSRNRSSSQSAYSGSRSPSVDRRSSSRGATSRGTSSFGGSRSMGGGSRGGGRRR
jgi:uncharacterized membrane protein YgcG